MEALLNKWGFSSMNNAGWLSPLPRGEEKKRGALCKVDSQIAVYHWWSVLLNMHLGFQARGFHQPNSSRSRPKNPQSYQHRQHGQRPNGKGLDAPPPTKAATSYQPPAASFCFCKIFLCLHLLWSVFSTAASCKKVVTLTLGVSVFQGPSGRWWRINTIDDELNLSMWAVLLQRINFPMYPYTLGLPPTQ